MKTVGLRINQSGKEKKLEEYIKEEIEKSKLSITDTIKEGLYKAIKFDGIDQDYKLIQEELRKKEQQIEILYSIIEKFKGQPIYLNSGYNNDSFKSVEEFKSDKLNISDDDFVEVEEELSDDDLKRIFNEKYLTK